MVQLGRYYDTKNQVIIKSMTHQNGHWWGCLNVLSTDLNMWSVIGGKYREEKHETSLYKMTMQLSFAPLERVDFMAYQCVCRNTLGLADTILRLYRKLLHFLYFFFFFAQLRLQYMSLEREAYLKSSTDLLSHLGSSATSLANVLHVNLVGKSC